MQSIEITICGNRYKVSLDDELALFVENNLNESGIYPNRDNKPDKLIQAYLKMAKQIHEQKQKIENIIEKFDI